MTRDARLHAHQARRRQGGPPSRGRRHPGRRHPRQQEPGASARRRLRTFAMARSAALVATDIAARGIDVDEVTPRRQLRDARTFRRATSTASAARRAPAPRASPSRSCDNEERVYLKDIEKLTRQQIPSEDRRNDAGLKADERAPNEKHNGDRRRDGGRGDSRGRQQAGGRSGPSKPRTHGDRASRPAHAERPARSEHAARGEHSARADRPTRSERPAHSERPRHSHERPAHRGEEHVSELCVRLDAIASARRQAQARSRVRR